MRVLGPRGSPNARNLFAMLYRLQSASGVSLRVRPKVVPMPKKNPSQPGRHFF
jgi:hypothetical protein